MSSSSGTKVTSDPQSQDLKMEKPGTIISDSLASESLSSGGDFASGTGAAASGQSSKGSTANNTDISGATTLNAAPDAEARQASEAWSETAQFNAGRNLGGQSDSSSSGTAPSSYAAASGGKPAGANITEGGFDSDAPNASYNTDIGSKNDPGRAAVGAFQKSANEADAGSGNKQGGVSNDGQFDILKDASA